MIFKLNPKFQIRNEDECSYLIKQNGMATSVDDENFPSVTILPPAIGYLLENIGRREYGQSLKMLSSELGISQDVVKAFLDNLTQDCPKRLKTSNHDIIFPKHLLIPTDTPTDISYHRSLHYSSGELRLKRPIAPINLNLMVTTRCSTNCRYCYAKRQFDDEMSSEEIINLIEKCYEVGVVNLNLTGGDIFARKDWRDILAAARKLKYNPFLSTKTPLKEEDVIFLRSIGIQEVQFSLDANDYPTLHYLIAANSNYMERVTTMFNECEKYHVKLCIRTVLCRQNAEVDKVLALFHFISHYQNIKDWVLTPAFFSDNNRQAYQQLAVPKEKLIAVRRCVHGLSASFPIYLSKISSCGYELKLYPTVEAFVSHNQKCYANTYSMSVLATGDCTVCEMLYDNKEYLLGNIREKSLHDIWNSPKALAMFSPEQEDTPKDSPCHGCGVFNKCRKQLAKRVCYVDIAKINQGDSFGLPDPRCPMAKNVDVIL